MKDWIEEPLREQRVLEAIVKRSEQSTLGARCVCSIVKADSGAGPERVAACRAGLPEAEEMMVSNSRGIKTLSLKKVLIEKLSEVVTYG